MTTEPIKLLRHPEPELVVVYVEYDVGRNLLCPCNSGKKYKKCCYPLLTQEPYTFHVATYEELFPHTCARTYYLVNAQENPA